MANGEDHPHDDGAGRSAADRVLLVGGIVSPMAHELNNVSGALRMAVALIAGDSEAGAPADAEDLAALKSLLGRIEDLSTALHEIARPQPNAEPACLRTTAERVVSILARLGRTRTAAVEIVGDGVHVTLGRVELEELLMHLVANALESFRTAKRATRNVTIAIAQIDGGAECLVTDNGAGIEADLLPTVFEPYVTTKPRAAGMGLPRARAIARGVGGDVTLATESDRGTTARVRLPKKS